MSVIKYESRNMRIEQKALENLKKIIDQFSLTLETVKENRENVIFEGFKEGIKGYGRTIYMIYQDGLSDEFEINFSIADDESNAKECASNSRIYIECSAVSKPF